MKYINLTTHEIKDSITGIIVKPSGISVRVDNPSICTGKTEDGIPLYSNNPKATVVGLPIAEKGTIYIVSSLVLNHVPNWRTDIVGTGAPQRDQDGKVIACKGFRTK
jgi:hypothetical protein